MVNKAIENRRSVREYKVEPVENTQIEEIIKAGQFAPTAKNNREVQFVVIENKETREKLAGQNLLLIKFFMSGIILIRKLMSIALSFIF